MPKVDAINTSEDAVKFTLRGGAIATKNDYSTKLLIL